MCETYICFLLSLLVLDTGWDRHSYERGIVQDWQLDQKAGGPIERWFPDYESWNDLSDEEWEAMSYRSQDSRGFVGYHFGEARLIELEYYQASGDGETSVLDNTWDGTWTGKNGVNSLEDFKTKTAQVVAIEEAFGYDLRVLQNQLSAYGKSLDDFIGKDFKLWEGRGGSRWRGSGHGYHGWHRHLHRPEKEHRRVSRDRWDGDDSVVEVTLSGIIAASHLRGPFSTAAFLLDGSAHSDEGGRATAKILRDFGGYDTPDAEELIGAFDGPAVGDEGLGSMETLEVPPESEATEAADDPAPEVTEAQPSACESDENGVLPDGCLRWQPRLGDSWHWQLQGEINETYDVAIYDVDLFTVPVETIARLRARGIRVLCYFSAGSSEDWRPDSQMFRTSDMSNPLDGWPGERWLDIRSDNVRAIMSSRIELAAEKGCDGVEPDNVDGFEGDNRTGFDLTAADQLAFNRFLADEAHRHGLAVALKNNVAQLGELAASFDLAVNERCHEYQECEAYSAFTSQGKPVLNTEYASKYRIGDTVTAELCSQAASENLSTLVLPLELDDSFRAACQ